MIKCVVVFSSSSISEQSTSNNIVDNTHNKYMEIHLAIH